MQSTRPYRTDHGFSLVETLVALTIVSAVMATMGGFFVTNRNFIQRQMLRIETTQALRATLDSLERDLRLGGACLPTNGNFVALAGSNAGTIDGVTTRTGLVNANLTCIRTSTSAGILATDGQIPVMSASGFAAGTRIYIRNPNGTGELFTLTGVDAVNNILVKGGSLTQAYPINSGVYAVDERQYAIDTTTNPALPVLTIAVNGASPVPFAFGIEAANIQYQLNRNCPTCDVVDLPANDAEWALVNQLYLTVTARSRVKASDGQYIRLTRQIGVKPRNLLP